MSMPHFMVDTEELGFETYSSGSCVDIAWSAIEHWVFVLKQALYQSLSCRQVAIST